MRRVTGEFIHRSYQEFFTGLTDEQNWALARLTLALADGYFIAAEYDDADLGESFDVMAGAILGVADQFAALQESKH